MDKFINNISNIKLLSKLAYAIHEEIYISYFANICPDIYLPEPRVPIFPPTTKNYANINNYNDVKTLVNNNLMYIKMLELYHTRIFALVETASRGLLQVLSY